MSTDALHLDVVTPEGKKLSEDVDEVMVRSTEGEMGFLKNHSPLVASLVPHVLRYKINGQEHRMFVSGGFVEVADNIVSVATMAAEFGEEIDFERAERARERALKRLHDQEHVDIARAEAALARANVRLSFKK